jgi:polyhydroxybutyrate depolymerase
MTPPPPAPAPTAPAAAPSSPRRATARPLLALALLLAGDAGAAEGDPRPCTLMVDGVERSYLLCRPAAPAPLPVVIMLHGGGGSGEAARVETGWDRKAAQEGFIAVFPEALPRDRGRPARFRDNPRIWNDGRAAFADAAINDDVGFIARLIEELIAHQQGDPRRVFVTGFSNGSSMAYRAGYQLSDRIAAIAPISSTGLRIRTGALTRPVPLFSSHGTADPLSPFAGGERQLGLGRSDDAPAPATMVAQWAALIGCGAEPTVTRSAAGITETAFRGPDGHIDVVFCAIDGAGHTWPGGRSLLPESLVGTRTEAMHATDRIWDFFLHHPKP